MKITNEQMIDILQQKMAGLTPDMEGIDKAFRVISLVHLALCTGGDKYILDHYMKACVLANAGAAMLRNEGHELP